MRLGINLRGDLEKLDDAEISARYEHLISEMEKPFRQLLWHGGRIRLWRGPLHARIFYKIQISLLRIIGIFSQSWITDKQVQRYLLECELSDVQDEIKRRVQQRRLAATS